MSDKPVEIPVAFPLGPGSQPDEDGPIDFMTSPGPMFTRDVIRPLDPEDLSERPAARQVLHALWEALGRYEPGNGATRIELNDLDLRDLDVVYQVLGEGEVSLTVEQEHARLLGQESVLAGVWHMRESDSQGRTRMEYLEVGDIPSAVRMQSFSGDRSLDLAFAELPEGVQNAPALLTEIADKLADPGARHVINLTLLPLTPQDLIFLGERLGVGPTTILSRGYGNCRIGATAKDRVWWVKYFNSEEKLILNTIEVTDVPEVALAAPEDLSDSRARLEEILEMYR